MCFQKNSFLHLSAYCLCLFFFPFPPLAPVAKAAQPAETSSAIESAKCEGVLDKFQISGNTLKAHGWAGAGDSSNAVVGISIVFDGVEIYSGGFEKQPRPDVAQAKGRSDWLESGFLIQAPINASLPEGPRKFTATALLKNGDCFDLRVPEELLTVGPALPATPAANPPQLLGQLDEVVLEGNQLKVRGWVASADPAQQSQTILLKSGEETLYRGEFQIEERPDVAKALGKPDLVNSGWIVRLDWSGKPAPSSITPHFEMETGEILSLTPLPAAVQAPIAQPAPSEALMGTRLAWLAAFLLAGGVGVAIYRAYQRRGNSSVPHDLASPPLRIADISLTAILIAHFSTVFILIVFAIAIFYKAPHQFINPQFWAEDGEVFFLGALQNGLNSLFMPYAGYLHLIPRVVAYFSAFFAPIAAPVIYVYSSFIIIIFIAYCYSVFFKDKFFNKILFIFSIVFVPGCFEIWFNLTNLQWSAAPFILVVFFTEQPKLLILRFLISICLICVCLTGPFSILFLPFVTILVFLQKFSIYRIANFFILSSCALVQMAFMFSSPRLQSKLPSIGLYLEIFFNNFLGVIFLGKYLAPISETLCYITGFLFLAWVLFCLIFLEKKDVIISSSLLVLSFGLLWIGVLAAPNNDVGVPPFIHGISPFTHGMRYFYIPTLLIIWLLGFLIKNIPKFRVVSTSWLVLIAFSAISSYTAPPLVDLKWYEIMTNPNRSEIVPINPAPWKISIPNNAE